MIEKNNIDKISFKNIRFKKVKTSDSVYLYELLSQREPITNISHKKMPDFLQHKKFVDSNPYSYWYVVFLKNTKIGTIYLTSINEIGIHLKNEFKNLGIEEIILNKLFQKHPRKRYLANVNPKNKKLTEFYKKHGFKLIQYTYEYMKR